MLVPPLSLAFSGCDGGKGDPVRLTDRGGSRACTHVRWPAGTSRSGSPGLWAVGLGVNTMLVPPLSLACSGCDAGKGDPVRLADRGRSRAVHACPVASRNIPER